MDLKNDENKWNSKLTFQMLLYSQYIWLTNMTILPNTAVMQGATGNVIILIIFYAFLGTPLTYMESIVGQFTERDCIDVWKIRPCFSHVGYILFGWQLSILIFNHVTTSFALHFFFISFENPMPYYTCGPWSNKDCNIMTYNYTVIQECIQIQNFYSYCDDLYRTFPEYQYWRFHLLQINNNKTFYIAWRVSLASGIICAIMYFMCFKREKSLKYSEPFVCIIPMIGLLILFMGAMRQKGIVAQYELAIDLNFKEFFENFRLSYLIQIGIHSLTIGSGMTFNLTSSSSFRTKCFSNCVICVSLSALYTTLAIFTLAMVGCPYANEYNAYPADILNTPLSIAFEIYPRLIYLFEDKKFYLILLYTIVSVLGIGSNVANYFNIIEVLLKRSSKLAYYPGLTCFFGIIILFFITIPLFNDFGLMQLTHNFRKHIILIHTFIALLECLVFLMWYGIHRFSEDVHFMLGIQPSLCMKFAWLMANVLLCYAFFNELLYQMKYPVEVGYAPYAIVAFVLLIVIGIVVHLIVALLRNNFWRALALDPNWGPKCDVLQRSRGMFSAQAMTKEYMYRQYHLQAGIIERQKRSNVRVV